MTFLKAKDVVVYLLLTHLVVFVFGCCNHCGWQVYNLVLLGDTQDLMILLA